MILFQFVVALLITFVVAMCYLIAVSFTIWMIVDAGKQDRFWWLTVIIGVPVIGPAAYYFTEKKHEYRRAEIHHIHTSETEEQHEKAPKKKSSRKAKKENKEVVSVQSEELSVEENKEKEVSVVE